MRQTYRTLVIMCSTVSLTFFS